MSSMTQPAGDRLAMLYRLAQSFSSTLDLDEVCADATAGMFVTLFYGLLHPQSGVLAYVNAGHNPPL